MKIRVRESASKGKHSVQIFEDETLYRGYDFYSPGFGSQSAMQQSMDLAKRAITELLAKGGVLDVDLTDFGGRVIEFREWLSAQVEAQSVTA